MLVPTRVGMILIQIGDVLVVDSCPHTRGDDPALGLGNVEGISLSPHAWG